jgi:hypothetical protein
VDGSVNRGEIAKLPAPHNCGVASFSGWSEAKADEPADVISNFPQHLYRAVACVGRNIPLRLTSLNY